jgi:signal transduction histidine kinase
MTRTLMHFTVDAALLRELGERLVGQPHIALAELVKNGYDADARRVHIIVGPNRLVVEDDGHGMSIDDFRNYWMRIGTSHKQDQGFSASLGRPLTGSKGIGRLAVQFLGRQLYLSTTSLSEQTELSASVDWNKAVSAGDLTSATAMCSIAQVPGTYLGSKHGTRVEIADLNNDWTPDSLADLATEVWTLQPPTRAHNPLDPRSFAITLESPDEEIQKAFATRLSANLDLWTARVRGELLPHRDTDRINERFFSCIIQFRSSRAKRFEFPIQDCLLSNVRYDIRIFSLQGRQRYGISVTDARRYFKAYGGIHIYDAGFHLPYYGPDVDWLKVEIDHSHRLSRSALLPEDLQVVDGLNNLPTMSRLYGVVEIDTSLERRQAIVSRKNAGDSLEIQISRDRLVDNRAYKQLVAMIRTALDLYAMQETSRRLDKAREALRGVNVRALDLPDLQDLVTDSQERIPPDLFHALRDGLAAVANKSKAFHDLAAAEVGLVGSLATVGITSLALQHETNKQLLALDRLASEIDALSKLQQPDPNRLLDIAKRLRDWLVRSRSTQAILSPLLDEEDRTSRTRLAARTVLSTVVENTRIFTRGIPIDFERVTDTLNLPNGSIAEWTAIFQNVLVNATNALLDSASPMINISSRARASWRAIIVQDNGIGIDIKNSDALFRPFAREQRISPERRQLGLGGTGLGLTIVRMIAEALNCQARFVEPEEMFKTAFELSWTEEA